MARKIKAQITKPVQDADGTVVYQPGELFDEDDKTLKDLPPDHVTYVIVDEPDESALSLQDQGAVTDEVKVSKATSKGSKT